MSESVSRVKTLFDKIEMANDARDLEKHRKKRLAKLARHPKALYGHFSQSRAVYIATGAFFDESARLASRDICDELIDDMKATGLYSREYKRQMKLERLNLRRACRSYLNSSNEYSAKSAKRRAEGILNGLNFAKSTEKILENLDDERAKCIDKRRKQRALERRVAEAREAEKLYWKAPSIKREISLNRVGKFIDGSEAKKEFLENRVENYFAEAGSLGIEGHKLKELAMYFNGAIEEPYDSTGNSIVNDAKEILRGEFKKLGIPQHYSGALMAKFDGLRKRYHEQKRAFYAAFNNAPVSN